MFPSGDTRTSRKRDCDQDHPLSRYFCHMRPLKVSLYVFDLPVEWISQGIAFSSTACPPEVYIYIYTIPTNFPKQLKVLDTLIGIINDQIHRTLFIREDTSQTCYFIYHYKHA